MTKKAANKGLTIVRTPDTSEAQAMANAALTPAVNAAVIVDAYQNNILGDDVGLNGLVHALNQSTATARTGDLSELEAMLIGQATALQSIFVSLAKRAQHQSLQRNLEAFLGLALKAQAQSRSTISALVDLKYPRQATFVRQANIAHGPQQINNAAQPPQTFTHAGETGLLHNELLEDASNGGTIMDTGATRTAARSDSTLETVETIHRPNKRKR